MIGWPFRRHRVGDPDPERFLAELARAHPGKLRYTDLDRYRDFHKYIDNEADEAPMAEYAESLGYRFETSWAYFMPIEKVLAKLGEGTEHAVIDAQDEAVLRRLALPVERVSEIAIRDSPERCKLLEDYLVIDVKGDVFLCCAASGHPSNCIGSYLDLPLQELQERKRRHSLCGSCMKQGVPILDLHGSHDRAFERIGRAERSRWQSGAR